MSYNQTIFQSLTFTDQGSFLGHFPAWLIKYKYIFLNLAVYECGDLCEEFVNIRELQQ